MHRMYALAAASLLFLGVSTAAVAAPIVVTYGFGPGVGTVTWQPIFNAAPTGTPGSGMGGGQMVVVYTSGSTGLGGTLGSGAQMQILQLTLTSPGSVLAQPVTGIGVGGGAAGVRTLGGAGNFGGPTLVSASAFGPGQPPFTMSDPNVAIGFVPLGSITIMLSGSGNQNMGLANLTGIWTITGIVGQEISRAVVPEPGTGVLLLGSLAGLAYGVRRLRR